VLALLNFLKLTVVVAAAGAFTTRPQNQIGLADDQFTLACVDDAATINWLYDNDRIIGDGCTSTVAEFTSTGGANPNLDCTLNVQAASTNRKSGPYTCTTGTNPDQNSEAVIVVIGQYTELLHIQCVG